MNDTLSVRIFTRETQTPRTLAGYAPSSQPSPVALDVRSAPLRLRKRHNESRDSSRRVNHINIDEWDDLDHDNLRRRRRW